MDQAIKSSDQMVSAKTRDGRTARADNTRRRIVSALVALIEEGQLTPTAAAIAERAGVSVRSVFQHFTDLDTAFQAAADHTMERVWTMMRPIPETGTAQERVDTLLDMRWNIYEEVAAVRRAGTLLEHRSPVVARRRTEFREILRRLIELTFAPELNLLPREARTETLDAMLVIADFEYMEVLRQQMGLSRVLACRVQRRALLALLAAATGH